MPASEENALERIEEIFSQALGYGNADERRAYLNQACEGEPRLLAEVLTLLEAGEQAPAYLDSEPSSTVWDRELSLATPEAFSIPDHTIERKLGSGGLGTVYLAFDQKLRRAVAIKVLHATTGMNLRARVLGAARKAAALRDPGIVTVYSVWEAASPAIIMEWVEGFRIDQATAALTRGQQAGVLREVARALAKAHRQGIVHRDLKPENVLVTPELQPKILDFGLAIAAGEGEEARRRFEGTPGYASPEQAEGGIITAASDVFSFGCLMYRVLTGRAPFERPSVQETLEAVRTQTPPFPREVAVGVPEELQAICLACLGADPAHRPTAADVAVDLGRYLAGEPVRLHPALYGDVLRKRISEYAHQLANWEHQGMILANEKDRIQAVHRRILADEDHWIIDARKISPGQAILYTATWLVVVGAGLFVWLSSEGVRPPWNWGLPLVGSAWLLGAGIYAARKREALASASFLAGAVLSLMPTLLALFRRSGIFGVAPASIQQLLPDLYTNQQILAASLAALLLSGCAWRRLRLTGFAWTTALLGAASYLAGLLCGNWLAQPPEIQALWCLPLAGLTAAGLRAEQTGNVRWALPFYLTGGSALVAALDVIATKGPTLAMVGLNENVLPYLDRDRQMALSLALNGYFFLGLSLWAEGSKSLDLRRASRVFEPLALVHILGALYVNAQTHRDSATASVDAGLYIASVLFLLGLASIRKRWRTLLSALAGVALGSHLLIDLGLVSKTQFTIGLMWMGILFSAATYGYLVYAPKRSHRRTVAKARAISS